MTILNVGALDARNIGSTVKYRDESEQATVLGTVQSIKKFDNGKVQLSLSTGEKCLLDPRDKVDITLPPMAHFQRESSETLGQTRELMQQALAELEDLSDDVVEYLEGRARASAVDLTISGAVAPVPSPSAVAAVMGARAAVGATL